MNMRRLIVARKHVPSGTIDSSDGQGNSCGFPRLPQRDIPGLRSVLPFSRTMQGTIPFRNQ
jgi:hypothetical protein